MRTYFNVLIIFCLSVTGIISQNPVPYDWYYGNPGDGFTGISMKQAYNEYLKNKATKTVVVAVIDSGIDIEHEDLAPNIWINPGEIPGNGIDDDKNGYIDDVHGWSFIGGPDGKNVSIDSYEATRVYGKLKYKYENANVNTLNKSQKKEYDIYLKAKETVDKGIEKANAGIKQLLFVENTVMNSLNSLEKALGDKPLNTENLDAIDATGNQELTLAKNMVIEYMIYPDIKSIDQIKTVIKGEFESDKKIHQDKLDYSFNPDFDPRATIVKDNYADVSEKFYGNNNVEGPDPMHGTHVGGIIGAVRNNDIGMDGIAHNVKIMSVRAVPDGDERDKDVANAIRYAVDNGATVINMSFGKGFGTHKNLVDEAVKYAAKKDVLLVHAAGNDGKNNDEVVNFPNANFEKKSGFLCKKQRRAKNWIEVGALSYKGGEDAVAPFSNYGIKEVDVFAPGMKMYSTLPNSEYGNLQGTSMASPVVAGVAATIRSVYPALTAEQVKEVVMKSVTSLNQDVRLPGSRTERINFSKLSVSGGVVNLDKALQFASKMKGKNKIKELKV